MRTRYCNAKTTEITRAVKRTFKADFASENIPANFYHYMVGVLKLKDVSRMNYDNITVQNVNDFHD